MRCLKCGERIPSGQFFCAPCGEAMEEYPVKPGTPVKLPPRAPKPAPVKKGRAKKTPTPEVQVARQRRSITILTLALAVTLVAFAMTALLALQLLEEREQTGESTSFVDVSRETSEI